MRFTLRHLEVFFAIGRHNSVSKAALELNLTQSATSMALADFERQVSTQLFDRVGKKLLLNTQGQVLLPKVKALLDRAHELEHIFDTQLGFQSIHLGATLTIGNYLAPPLIAKYWEAYPEAQIKIQVHNTTEILNRLCQFEMDLALIEGECHHQDLIAHEWKSDELTIFAAPNHPFANGKEIDFEKLLNEKWILREQGSGTRQLFDRSTLHYHSAINVIMELEHTEGIKRAVEAGMGIGCISTVALKDAFARGSLKPIYVKDISFKRNFYLVTHKQKYLHQSVLSFIEFIRGFQI